MRDYLVEHYQISPFDDHGKAKERHVRAAYLLFPPYVIRPGGNPLGMDASIIKLLSSHMKFSLEFLNRGSFNGIVNALRNGEADVAISHPNIDLPRYRFGLDMLALYSRDFVLAQRYPGPADKIYAIATPFSTEVWLAVFVTASAVTAYFTFSLMFYTDKFSLSFDNLVIGYITLVGQSVSWNFIRKKQFESNFIVLFLWITMAFILSSAYETNLLANLVKVDLETQPQTFQVANLLGMRSQVVTGVNSVIFFLSGTSGHKGLPLCNPELST